MRLTLCSANPIKYFMRRRLRVPKFRLKLSWHRFIAGLMIAVVSMSITSITSHASPPPQSSYLPFFTAGTCDHGSPAKDGDVDQPRFAHCICYCAIPQETKVEPFVPRARVVRSSLNVGPIPAPETAPLPKPPRA